GDDFQGLTRLNLYSAYPTRRKNNLEHQHIFAVTPDGALAGTWRSTDRMVFPICKGVFDLPEGLLHITRGRVTRAFDCPLSKGLTTDAERRRNLPRIALDLSRTIRQPR